MIGAIFSYSGEFVEVRIDKDCLYFRGSVASPFFATLEGLKFSYEGTIKEHPDLEGREDWKEEAIKRLKEKIKSIRIERDKMIYVVKELKKVGYVPMYMQEQGFRPVKFK
jgi:hypothetical protein